MNSLTRSQLTALLLITDIFTLICFRGQLSVWTAAGYAIGTAVQLMILIPLASIELPKIFYPSALVYLIVFGSILFKRLWDAVDVTFIPSEASSGTGGRLLITLLIAAVCLYISSTGMKAAARSSVIAAAAGVLFLIIDLASAVIHYRSSNITDSLRYSTIYDGIILSMTSGGLPVMLLTLIPLVKNSKRSAVVQYYSCRMIICTSVLITSVLVTGGIMRIANFPVIMSAQLSQPFTSQRIDPLFLMLFAVFGVFSLTAHIMSAAYLIKELFPKFNRWRSTAAITATLIGAMACVLLSGCSSTGLVHDKLYLRSVGIEKKRMTMTFFSDENALTVECSDIPTAKKNAELETGKPIVTGFTEMIILGDCNKQQVLEYMLKTWKVSPSCMAVYSNSPIDTLKNCNTEQLEGAVKEAVKKGLSPECDIVYVLGKLLNHGNAEVPETNREGFVGTENIAS